MVSSCCVKNCHNTQSREKDRKYYDIPTVVKTQGKEMEEITTRRRRMWLAQLRLKDLTFEADTRHRKVCSDHFVNGVKAYVRDVNSASWIPTLKLGHNECKEASQPSDDRYQRQLGRRSSQLLSPCERSDETLIVQGEGEPMSMNDVEQAAPPPPPLPDSDGYGVYCQTDTDFAAFTLEEEKRLRDELNRRIQENMALKEQLAKKEMTLESLSDQNDTVKYYTGLPDFVMLNVVFNFVKANLPSDKRRALTAFQAFMLTLMHMRLNTPLQHLAYIFCVSRTTASKVFHETLHVLFYRLQPMVFWPDKQSIRTSLPAQFKEHPWRKVVSIIDCFEIFIERPSTSDASALTWSNYKHNNTIKYLISITPQAHISFISKGWGGRVSDKKLTAECGYLNNLLPNDLVLADRGFDIAELVAMQGAEVKIPAFTKGKSQLPALEVESTRNLAHLRIHVERVIGVVIGKYTILSSTVPTELLFTREDEEITSLDKIVTVACALVNMCPGIV